jgi:hypothetical protein
LGTYEVQSVGMSQKRASSMQIELLSMAPAQTGCWHLAIAALSDVFVIHSSILIASFLFLLY